MTRTTRAVASLDKLVRWSFPLLPSGGRLLALKGGSAATELEDARPLLQELGVTQARLHVLGEGRISEPVRVVEIVRPEEDRSAPRTGAGRGRRRDTQPRRGKGRGAGRRRQGPSGGSPA